MRNVRILTSCACLALAWTQTRPADAQTMRSGAGLFNSMPATQFIQAPAGPQAPSTPQAPGRPAAPADQAAQAPQTNLFGEAAPSGTEAPGGAYAPQMLGDSVTYFTSFLPLTHNQLMAYRAGASLQSVLGLNPATPISGPISVQSVLLPSTPLTGDIFATALWSLAGSAWKISDNESPRPETRAFLNLDYISGINHGARAFDPADFGNQRVARAIFGYEHTFLDGDASIELRVPVFGFHVGQSINEEPINFSDVGDITVVTKFALVNDRDSGNVLTAGMAVTLPTGPAQPTVGFFFNPTVGATGTLFAVPNGINFTILQPYVGYIYYLGQDLFVQGFSSVAFPLRENVPTVWFNDIGVGYYASRGASCSIVPTAELHLTTPFNHDSLDSFPVGAPDALIATLGVHFLWHESVLTLGYDFPLSGPQPFSSELVAQFNYRF